MDGSNDYEAHLRNVNGQENFLAILFDHAAFAQTQPLSEHFGQRIIRYFGSANKSLITGENIRYQDEGATRGSFGIESGKEIDPHQSILST
jgi:hypothetical protein